MLSGEARTCLTVTAPMCLTVTTVTGAPSGIRMRNGESPTAAGVIRSQRPRRLGFRSVLRDLIPRCETSQGFYGLGALFTCGVKLICRRWTRCPSTFAR